MIRCEYRIEHRDEHGKVLNALDGEVTAADLAIDLPKEINTLVGCGFAPAGMESVFVSLTAPLRHVTLGISTHNVRERAKRRLLERLWPHTAVAIDAANKAAFLLVRDGKAYLHTSPFYGLVASRTF